MTRPFAAAATLALLSLASPASVDAATFAFSYSFPAAAGAGGIAVAASGTLTATPTGNPDEFLVSAITGTRNGESILALVAPGGFGSNDNLVYTAGPALSFNGLTFTVAGAGNTGTGLVNVYYLGPDYAENDANVGFSPDFTLRLLPAPPTGVPVPASAAMLAAGVGLLGLGLRRRRAA